MPIIHHPSRPPGEPWTAESLAAELIWQDYGDGYWDQAVHQRLVALEEALVSRRARRRLRRAIRQSADTFAWAGPTFYGKRLEAVSNEYLFQMAEREARWAA